VSGTRRHREADDDQVELLIGSRTYRVRRAEVRLA